MTPERWQKVTGIFGDAIDLPPDARAAFLDSQCGGDAQLRAEVETLLRSDAQAGGFLETGPLDQRRAGTRVGPWLLERLIGQGGMGAVWEASRAAGGFTQRAALKFVRVGLDDDGAMARRFVAERQILAGLQHAHIGRLLDGGTADGRPYLAMEYIEGKPLDVYCRDTQAPLAERLKLFLTICGAVAYAHQRLIVHRDLKPANVLVTADGVPMLLDFGIARILDATGRNEASELTKAAPSALTPAYASPEQIRGEPVTTASDVFSLGIVLYELVAGERPFGKGAKSADTVIKAVLEDEPRRPSPFADLDSVILKALEKDPGKRYSSVDRFAEDVRRFTRGEPVDAYQASFFYRARKLVFRHRALSALIALLTASLLAGISATSWQAHVASVERAKAEKRAADVRAIANSLIFEVHDAILYLPGATEARAKVTKKAVEYLDGLSNDERHDPQIDRELAAGYQKVAEALNYTSAANLGDVSGATRAYEKALALRAPLTQTAEDRAALALLQGSFGVHLLEQGDVARSLEVTKQAFALRQAALAAEPTNPDVRRAAANTENYLGDVLAEAGDLAGAHAAYQHVGDAYAALVALEPKSAKYRWGLICSEVNLADTQRQQEAPGDARPRLERALALNTALEVDRPDHYSVLQGYGIIHHALGELSVESGDLAAARASFLRALTYRQGLVDKDPLDHEAAMNVALTRTSLGALDVAQGRAAEGFKALDAAAAALARLAVERPSARRIATAQVQLLLARADVDPANACAQAKEAEAKVAAQRTAHPQLATLVKLEAKAKAAVGKHCR